MSGCWGLRPVNRKRYGKITDIACFGRAVLRVRPCGSGGRPGLRGACAGEREMTELCVVADTSGPVSPCGACRQVMREFGIQTVILANMKGDFKITTVEELLPYGFEL